MRKSDPGSWLLGAIVVAGMAFALVSRDKYHLNLLMWVALGSLLAASLRFVILFGEKNIATAAFCGLGAYMSAIMTVMFKLPLWLSLLSGAFVAAGASALFGFIALRIKGPYFMLVSFALTELVRLVYTKIDWIGGAAGIPGIFPPKWFDAWMPLMTVIVVGALMIALYACERSNLGRIVKAINDNDAIVASVGIDPFRIKLLCLIIASFAAGMAGALQAHTATVISPADFGYGIVIYAFAYLKIGGQSHLLGCVVGAALLILLAQSLQGAGAIEQILFGGAIVAGMLFMPDGFVGWIRKLYRRLRAAPAAGVKSKAKSSS